MLGTGLEPLGASAGIPISAAPAEVASSAGAGCAHYRTHPYLGTLLYAV